MRSRILRCPDCRKYTLSIKCPACGVRTEHTFPPRFSPEDRWSRYRMMDHGPEMSNDTKDSMEE